MSLDIQLPRLSKFRFNNNSQRSVRSQSQRSSRSVFLRDSQLPQQNNPRPTPPPQQHQRVKTRRSKMRFDPRNMYPRNMSIPNPREMRQKFQEGTSASGYLIFGWLLSAILAIIIPVSKWAAERNRYYRYYGQYKEYEMQQRQYEQQQNGNYNYYNLCSWWNFKCRYNLYRYQQMYGNNQGGQNGQGGENQQQMAAMLPRWFFFFGGRMEEDERQREEMGLGQNESSMKFVYICTIIMFIGLSIFGLRSLYVGKDKSGIIAALLIFGQFSLMNLVTTVQGTIETDNRFFEDSVYGWYGQWAVLVAYTDFWLMIFCFIFATVLGLLRCIDKRKAASNVARDESDMVEMGYQNSQDDQESKESRYA